MGGKPELPAYLYWFCMLLGMPFSQPCGVFQGRSDKLSDSVLAHPPNANPATTSSSRNAQRILETMALTTPDARG